MGDAHAPPPPQAELSANWMVPAPAVLSPVVPSPVVPSPLLVHGQAQHQQQHRQEQQQQHPHYGQQHPHPHPHQHGAVPANGHFLAPYGAQTVTHEALPHAHAATSGPLPPPASTSSMLPLPLPPSALPPPQADASTVVAAAAPPPAPGTSTLNSGGGALASLLQPNPVAQLPLSDQLAHLHLFLATAPSQWDSAQRIRRFLLPNGEHVSCVWHNNLFFVTGTDVIRALLFRFQAMNRPVRNLKKFEEGIFSDLRNLKPGVDAALEESRFQEDEFFQSPTTQDALTRMLCVFTLSKRIAYKQGMHELAAILFWTTWNEKSAQFPPDHVEATAYTLYEALMVLQAPFFEGDTAVQLSERFFHVHLRAVNDELYHHLAQLGIEPHLFGLRWLRLLFAREYPLPDVAHLWDGLFCLARSYPTTWSDHLAYIAATTC
ncbi:hypothetical protein AMAG_18755 [Allomyces macrogynus ATCC 38327]|uniref:Rab-GAP TBC domain-containing protein n=1 Tax=Allomyces macrogynus (strain ATCC 38327) TaxID=578462 RepID=A0A0L0SFE9_ALLM3|nr:hypothetical protein AMAG_18755 [Allomyces macrogynus ATCC 38327]|eukprot:KNE61253.1 hypothetical protein AMAG_18755 [Allomyces macrogynus ATCC 38327]